MKLRTSGALGAVLLAVAVEAAPISEFTTVEPWLGHESATRDQTLAVATIPGGSGQALKLSWGAQRFHYAELHLKKFLPLPEFTKAVFTLRLYVPANTPASRIALRLMDQSGETFQFSKSFPVFPEAGWRTVEFTVDAAQLVTNSWGGNKNQRIDFPVRLQGFSVDFTADGGAGELYFESLDLAYESAKSDAALQTLKLTDFAKPEHWELFQGETRRQNAVAQAPPGRTKVGAALSWDGTKNSYLEYHLKNAQKLSDFSKAQFTLSTYLPAKAPVRSFGLRLVDAGNEVFQFTVPVQVPPDGGQVDVRFEVDPGNLSNASSWGGNNNKRIDFPVSLYGFASDFTAGSGQGNAWLLEATMTAPGLKVPSAAESITLDVETGNPVHVLRVGEEKELMLRFTNTGLSDYQGGVTVEFENFDGHSFTQRADLNLAAGASVTVTPKQLPDSLGIWYVRTRFDVTEGLPVTRSRTFAYFAPTGPTPGTAEGFLWGVSSHPQSHPAADQKLEALAAALVGIKVVREDIRWGGVQPERGRWEFGSMDRTVEIFGQENIELEAILCYCAPWAASEQARKEGWAGRAAPEINAWKEFCAAMAQRYRGKIRFYEVWNEPDLEGFARFGVDEYAEMMRTAYAAIKAADPDAVVLTGGYATMSDHPSKKGDFQEQTLVKGKGSYDIHAYHEHGSFYPHFVRMVEERFLPMRERTGTTEPWWANETALSSAGDREREQALALYKKLLYSWSRGAIGYNWYDLRNDGYDPLDGEHNYGMITKDFYPKAVYPVYNTLVSLFRGKEYRKQLDVGPMRWVLAFGDEKELVVAAWCEARASLAAVLRTDAVAAEAVDVMGNITPVPVVDGRVLLKLGSDPVSLRLKGAKNVEFSGNLVELNATGVAIPGRDYQFAATLVNPFDRAVEYQLTLTAPAGMEPASSVRKVTIPARESKTENFELAVTPGFRPAFGSELNLAFDYELTTDRSYSGRIQLPITATVLIPNSDAAARQPDFTLTKPEQVVSLFPADPTKSHLLWQGEKDLSGKLWLTAGNGKLGLIAEITDDKHVQPNTGSAVWRGDNLQLALVLPGQRGNWELGLTRLADGKPEVWCWMAPTGFTEADVIAATRLTTTREGNLTRYQAEIPFEALGLTPAMLKAGIRFNLLVNDNDGEGREGWIHVAPGIGLDKVPERYPFVIFE